MPLYTVPADDEKDPGIVVKYAGFTDKEWVIIRSVLSDDIVDLASDRANAGGTYKASVYRAWIILQMTIDAEIINPRTGSHITFSLDGLKRLSPQFKMWLMGEINKCDGSIEGLSTIEINGVGVPFRPATGVV